MNTATRANDYGVWKFMAWTGPIFFIGFFVMWGLLAENFPPVAASTGEFIGIAGAGAAGARSVKIRGLFPGRPGFAGGCLRRRLRWRW